VLATPSQQGFPVPETCPQPDFSHAEDWLLLGPFIFYVAVLLIVLGGVTLI
jgi:hypothetical protein